jgi:glycosyltransferase involved in cell wall biosynthesis
VTSAVIVDAAGGQIGGAARYRRELLSYLDRTGRRDVEVIGSQRRLTPGWLVRRELVGGLHSRRVAINNVGFVARGGQRWTLLRNALHFLTEAEEAALCPAAVPASVCRDAVAVRLAARRSDVIVVPSTAMAERVARVAPGLNGRIVVRAHPVSADPAPRLPREPKIICPVVFEPYKRMAERLSALLWVIGKLEDDSVRLLVTAEPAEVPAAIASHPRIELLGRLPHAKLREWQARSHAVYFPTDLESFGYPLAEARVNGQPVIACDTGQNREIAGHALCGYVPGDPDSLRHAVEIAITAHIMPDPAPFDPDRYFGWLLGPTYNQAGLGWLAGSRDRRLHCELVRKNHEESE